MRILLAGDRHWRCDELAEQIINRLVARYGPDLVVVHGGAPGVDQSFSVAGRELGTTVEPHVADWKGLANRTASMPQERARGLCSRDWPRFGGDGERTWDFA